MVSPWIPEDDLLLKNAVEAGASLEALAKGAVQFSRKFTVQELRDRWHSLLYDPDISAEASAHMVEYELSASNRQSKFNRAGNSKESAEIPAKRKVESIRRLYYALRKRTCNRSCDSIALSFIGSPNINDCIGDGNGHQEHVRLFNDPPVGRCMLGDCIQNNFGFQEIGVDILHHGAHHNNSKGVVRKDSFNEFHGKVPSMSVKETVRDDSFEQSNVHKDSPRVLGETLDEFGNCSAVERVEPAHASPDSGATFPSMGYSSLHPVMPLWNTIEDLINVSHGGKGRGAEETIIPPDDTDDKKINSSVYDVVHSGSMLKERHHGDEINSSAAISESDFVDISDSLLNFENEEELLFMDADGKDAIDKSCYDSLLLNSPNDVHEDVPDVKEPETLVSKTCLAISSATCPAELQVIADRQSHSGHGNQHSISYSEVNMTSSTLVPNPHPPEPHGGVMHCTLNSEDPEIPCNDDVLSGKAFASYITRTSHKEISCLASSFTNKKDSDHELSLMKREEILPETSPNIPLLSCVVKSEFQDSQCHALVSRRTNISLADPTQCRSVHAFPNFGTDRELKEEPLHACSATDVPVHAKASSTMNTILKPDANSLAIDQEEYESDDNIPYFSDIEAMILGMDLCPDDSDSCISREVSRYQHEDAKRTIIRLEQCARSSMQRAIASQGALAILYGRHLKYYIKKTEVILGRASDGIDVDIDLGREGLANKISRRQALIKLEGDGFFSLKNLGKGSIFLNGVEVATGQLTSLSSSNLIEIRGMAFVFEMNDKSVSRYLINVARKNQENNTNFEWSEEGVPRA